jgi:hypothetical protein
MLQKMYVAEAQANHIVVVPAQAGTHNPREWGCANVIEQRARMRSRGVWVPACAGKTIEKLLYPGQNCRSIGRKKIAMLIAKPMFHRIDRSRGRSPR